MLRLRSEEKRLSDAARRPRLVTVLTLATVLLVAGAPSTSAAGPPSNDELSGAASIAVPSQTLQDTSSATAASTDPPCFAGLRLGATVWFTFTTGPDDYATYYIDTFGSDYDTTVAFYSPGGQDEVYCTYDSKGTQQTYIEWPVYPDTTYYLLVGSATEATPGGNLVLNITDQAPPPPSPPPNDDIATATEITAIPFRDAFDASLATAADTDPVPYGDFLCGSGGSSVWYRFTPTVDTYLQLDTMGSEFRNTLTVLEGSPGSLEQVTDCDIDGSAPDAYAPWLEFAATAGTTYYVLVTSYPSEPAGFLVLNARLTVPFTIDVSVEPKWPINARQHYVTALVTVTCSRFGYVGLTGQLVQTSKTRTAFGTFFEPVTCGDTMPHEFAVTVDPESPDQFAVGRATLRLEARGESHESVDVEVIDTTVQLRVGR
jgi:hypothetical protein